MNLIIFGAATGGGKILLFMEKILVLTDFSDNAMKACLYAAEIAHKSGAIVYLLHVIEPVIDRIRQPNPLHGKLEEEIIKNRFSEVHAIRRSVLSLFPSIKIESELASGAVTASILECARKKDVDLIIMGTKGATGLKEIFMGSVATDTIVHATLPVLAIPEAYKMEIPDAILFATNHFEENTDLLEPIIGLAKLFPATIHTVVFWDTHHIDESSYLSNTMQLNNYMDFLKRSFPDVAFKGEVLKGENFEQTIVNYDEKNEVDIIAMITYPKSFWDRFLRKSITKQMTFHSKIPVLAIPSGYTSHKQL